MRKANLLCVICLFALLSVGISTVSAQHTPAGKAFPLASGVNILSPFNTTYSSSLPVLNVTIKSLLPPSMYQYEVTYSIDKGKNATLSTTLTFVPVMATVTYPEGTVNQTSVFGSYYLINGHVNLPKMPEGSHELTVYGKYERTYDGNPNLPAFIFDQETVCFIINYRIPPAITNLSIQNKTYNQNTLPLNFTTDEPASWIGYSLDGQTNVTIAGNTTLTELTEGMHSLTLYANDTVGNMGASETMYFNVEMPKEEHLPTEVVGAVGASASAAVIVFGLMLVSKKRH